MFPTTYTLSLFPPAYSYFWQFNPFIAMFNPTVTFSASGIHDFKLGAMSLTPKEHELKSGSVSLTPKK